MKKIIIFTIALGLLGFLVYLFYPAPNRVGEGVAVDENGNIIYSSGAVINEVSVEEADVVDKTYEALNLGVYEGDGFRVTPIKNEFKLVIELTSESSKPNAESWLQDQGYSDLPYLTIEYEVASN